MILADKIISLRKKLGWSQEQLAERLNVSRQSVSKWEGGLSIPDLDKIIKMSSIFGVSTDYLLKDEIDISPSPYPDTADSSARRVTVEDANLYMRLKEKVSGRTAAATALYIISPIPLLLLSAIAEETSFITENAAGGLGISILLVMVTAGVVIHIINGMKMSGYDFLETEDFYAEYGVKGVVEKKKDEFASRHRTAIACGVGLCIASAIPLLLSTVFTESDFIQTCMVCVILAMVSMGVYIILKYDSINESYHQLLQTGDFTPHKKYVRKKLAFLPGVYWCAVAALYLFISFRDMNWGRTWIIWPVAAVMYAAVEGIAGRMIKEKK